ncbi:MAG TPA: 50S ribosomal protein L18e [Candidatus Thermoplasmatota archaeon]|nr:50S ribosomal protein L18e [Candidatus Thermoplasmatota archaeon]
MVKTDPTLVATISALKARSREAGSDIWRDVARRLEKPNRSRAEVNVSRIDRYVSEGEIAVVPGKLLSAGILTKRVDVAALRFSDAARRKIAEKGGKCLSLEEAATAAPKGQKCRIVG